MLAAIEANELIVAIGECGLDYDRLHFSNQTIQNRVFPYHFTLAKATSLPLFLHDRNTNGDLLRHLSAHREEIKGGGVIHSFTGTLTDMRAYVELGLYIGVNGCSLKTEENLAVVKEIPADRLLLETDAPYCGITSSHASNQYVSLRFDPIGKEKWLSGRMVKSRSEPAMILQVMQVIAAIRGISLNELSQICARNTQVLFPRIRSRAATDSKS